MGTTYLSIKTKTNAEGVNVSDKDINVFEYDAFFKNMIDGWHKLSVYTITVGCLVNNTTKMADS